VAAGGGGSLGAGGAVLVAGGGGGSLGAGGAVLVAGGGGGSLAAGGAVLVAAGGGGSLDAGGGVPFGRGGRVSVTAEGGDSPGSGGQGRAGGNCGGSSTWGNGAPQAQDPASGGTSRPHSAHELMPIAPTIEPTIPRFSHSTLSMHVTTPRREDRRPFISTKH